ncbi:MAG: heterodisulfide reductase-related iron-sulfur binding cluster, partial [Halobacteria archaeon]
IIQAIGGSYIELPNKTKCCGGALLMGKEEIANQLAKNLLEEAKKLGANFLVVACPLCHTMLDAQQPKIEAVYKTRFKLPVLYFTQAIGLALGLDMREIGLDKHFVSPKLLQ